MHRWGTLPKAPIIGQNTLDYVRKQVKRTPFWVRLTYPHTLVNSPTSPLQRIRQPARADALLPTHPPDRNLRLIQRPTKLAEQHDNPRTPSGEIFTHQLIQTYVNLTYSLEATPPPLTPPTENFLVVLMYLVTLFVKKCFLMVISWFFTDCFVIYQDADCDFLLFEFDALLTTRKIITRIQS